MTMHITTKHLSRILLNKLGYSAEMCGVDDLESRAGRAAKGFGFGDTASFLLWLDETKLDEQAVTKLAVYFTTGETYFLREPVSFQFLEKEYLPNLLERRKTNSKTIKIWSAGCSTGEEPYSIAILLRSLIPDPDDWKIELLASDINPESLEMAAEGVYTDWSFRKCSTAFVEDNFRVLPGNRFQIREEIRKMVQFSKVNLAAEDFHSTPALLKRFDIIFCRNVLIYFNSDGIRKASRQLFECLREGGILVLSPVEMTHLIHPEFSRQFYDGYTFYLKNPVNGMNEQSKSYNTLISTTTYYHS